MKLLELIQHLDLLAEAGVITPKAAEVAKLVFERLRARSGDLAPETHLHALVLHVATALTRISRGKRRPGPPAPEVMAEVRSSGHFAKAQEEIHWLNRLWPGPLPEEEREYLSIHYVLVFKEISARV